MLDHPEQTKEIERVRMKQQIVLLMLIVDELMAHTHVLIFFSPFPRKEDVRL